MAEPTRTVHPRGRGEHAWGDWFIPGDTGSSPRARGTQRRIPVQRPLFRFIPAGAGNTNLRDLRYAACAVHPRGRGEHTAVIAPASRFTGSSPRARGTPSRQPTAAARSRFIPAGAGNTHGRGHRRAADTVHPRGRGEHRTGTLGDPWLDGSSPRARGTPSAILAIARIGRFIPAGAGNTVLRSTRCAAHPVHPRGRGEHWPPTVLSTTMNGSSPRARGTRNHPIRCGRPNRFIPAGAGNTARLRDLRDRAAVHPRGRGEHSSARSLEVFFSGSSPRARGTPNPCAGAGHSRRFIPAGAGNTRGSTVFLKSTAVHPRGRGEHSVLEKHPPAPSGSSPRARGTHKVCSAAGNGGRFIPAGAGNTPSAILRNAPGTVHPRGRGEHIVGNMARDFAAGSSPRARGTRAPSAPAQTIQSVHPRGRGEHSCAEGDAIRADGSSPRARGTRLIPGERQRVWRFIPAGAGNTTCKPSATTRETVHPRGRGEHSFSYLKRAPRRGSSPRARGTLGHQLHDRRSFRFIPAGAGNT